MFLRREMFNFNTGDFNGPRSRRISFTFGTVLETPSDGKEENIATTEVADVIGMLDFIEEANVYSVAVPDCEGKAGMASIILKPNISLDFGKSL
uniref:Putative prk08279 long-chain-acyl-coa synthetase n=1 Tax=Ixodes ricinus TaxID=34613 RepID=A0A0K8RDM9_IXORI